ncbi:thiol-disulfide oxidoreductase DCC family protein [Antarctobacter sp.]|uniref:thiol-disulfide oxidoreductase DCC family protein n=1 Tax=Antarctobacter sp. TaxID=1872577 RepID=UPI003A932EAD
MPEKLTVLYNDTCPICSREVDGYRCMTPRAGAKITYCGLSATGHMDHGLTEDAAARRFHVIHDGVLLSGMPAFVALWDQMPRLRWLAWLVRRPGLRQLTVALYDHLVGPMLYRMHLRRTRRQNSVSGPAGSR